MNTNIKSTLTVSQVAPALDVSRNSIYRHISSGRLKASKDAKGIYRIPIAGFVEFVKQSASSKSDLRLTDVLRMENSNRTKGTQTTRRKVLQVFGLVLTGAAAGFLGSLSNSLVYGHFGDKVLERQALKEFAALNLELIKSLFGGLVDLSWSAGLSHIKETYNITRYQQSSAIRASVDLGAALGLSGENWLENAKYTDGFPGHIISGTDIITTGSPISDPVTACLMEYHGPDRYQQRRSEDPLIDLSITFLNDRSLLPSGAALAKRYVAGEVREMPNWHVRVDGELVRPPKLDQNRWIQSDYLMIARVPNLIDRGAFIRGAEAVIVAGTHGVGTEAIGLLLRDNERLQAIQDGRGNRQYFQALISVDRIEHRPDTGIMRSIPESLGSVIVRPIELDYERIARRWLQKMLAV